LGAAVAFPALGAAAMEAAVANSESRSMEDEAAFEALVSPKKKVCNGGITKILIQIKPDSSADRGYGGVAGGAVRHQLRADKELGVISWQHLSKLNVDIAEVNCEESEDATETTLKAIKEKYGDSLKFAELDQVHEPPRPKGEVVIPEKRAGDTIPDDALWSQMWDQRYLNLPDAWEKLAAFNSNPREVLVAVIDTGVSINHPDLVNKIWTNPGEIPGNGVDDDGNGFPDDVRGWDFLTDTSAVTDPVGHGTHCAGTVAAEGNNGIGMVGVAGLSSNVKIVPLRGGMTSADVAAFNYCLLMGITVSSNSWEYNFSVPVVEAVLETLNAAGHVVVTAAGNKGRNVDDPQFSRVIPCNKETPNVICVASVTEQDTLSTFSNWGPTSVDIAAPGSDILSTNNDGSTYRFDSGTSMAAPHVAGAIGLLLSNFNSLTAMEARQLVLDTAVPKAYLQGLITTGGVMDVSAMVTAAINMVPTPAPATAAPVTPTQAPATPAPSPPTQAPATLAPSPATTQVPTTLPTGAPKPTVIPKPGAGEFCSAICDASHGTRGKAMDCFKACTNSFPTLEPILDTYCKGHVCSCSPRGTVTQTGLLELDEMTNEADSDHANLLQIRQKEVSMEAQACMKKNVWCNGVCTTAVCPISMTSTFKQCHESCMDPTSKFSELVGAYCSV